MSVVLGLAATFLVAPACIFLPAVRILRLQRGQELVLLALCLAIAPAFLGRLITWMLRICPGQSSGFYIIATGVALGMLALAGKACFPSLAAAMRQLARGIQQNYRALAVTFAFGTLFVLGAEFAFGETGSGSLLRAWLFAGWSIGGAGFQNLAPWWGWPILGLLAVAIATAVLSERRRRSAPMMAAGSETLFYRSFCIFVGAIVVGLTFLIVELALGRPIFENDATSYFKIATLMVEQRSLWFYPLFDQLPQTGMYSGSAHPVGHYGVLIWGFFIGGSSGELVAKIMVLHHVFAGLLGIWAALRDVPRIAALAAMALLLSTPAFFVQAASLSMDAGRLSVLLVGILWLREASRALTWLSRSSAGIVFGLALNIHSISLVVVPLSAMLGSLCFETGMLRRRILCGLFVTAVALAIGGEQFVLNFVQLGTPIYNDAPIFHLVPELNYEEWRFGRIGRSDLIGKLTYGPFIIFSQWYYFAFSYWAFLISGILCWRRILDAPEVLCYAGIVVLWIVFLIIFFGFTSAGRLYVGNYRYAITTLPLASAVAGWCASTPCYVSIRRRVFMTAAFCLVIIFQTAMLLASEVASSLPDARFRTFAAGRPAQLEAIANVTDSSRLIELRAIRNALKVLSPASFVLSFHQNVFAYYSDIPSISDLDPRLIQFYKEKDKDRAWKVLHNLGITHIFVPPWDWPTIDRSQMRSMLEDRRVTDVLVDEGGYKLFRLRVRQ